MKDPDSDRTEATRQIAGILATVYLRLQFPAPTTTGLDSSEIESAHGTAG